MGSREGDGVVVPHHFPSTDSSSSDAPEAYKLRMRMRMPRDQFMIHSYMFVYHACRSDKVDDHVDHV